MPSCNFLKAILIAILAVPAGACITDLPDKIHVVQNSKPLCYDSSNREIRSLARALAFEASTESQMKRVAGVIFNRVEHNQYPNTMRKVIEDRKQFSWVRSRLVYRNGLEVWNLANRLATKYYQQWKNKGWKHPVGNALAFANHSVSPKFRPFTGGKVVEFVEIPGKHCVKGYCHTFYKPRG